MITLTAGLVLMATIPAIASEDDSASLAALVKVNPLEVRLTLSDDSVNVGQRFLINVAVKNRGDTPLREMEMTLHVIESPCLKLSGPLTHYRGLLQDGRSASHVWHVQAIEGGSECRSIVVVASASAVDEADGETISLASQARLLEIH